MKINASLAVIASIMLLAGCIKTNSDPVDPSIPKELADLAIPAGFDWQTTSTVNLTTHVDNAYPGQNYLVEVFGSNPILSTDSNLLAKDLAVPGQPVTLAIVLPQVLKTLYVRQTNPRGVRLTQEYAIDGLPLIAYFGVVPAPLAYLQTKAAAELDVPLGIPTQYTTPTNAVEISAKNGVTFELTPAKGKAYVIKSNYEGGITFSGNGTGVELYVEGKWNNKASLLNMGAGDKLVIQAGGDVHSAKDMSIVMSNTALIFVAKGGQFNNNEASAKTFINASNGSEQLVNFGEFNATVLHLPAILYNAGTMHLGTFSMDNAKTLLQNDKTLTIDNAQLTYGTVKNNCLLGMGDCKTKGTAFDMGVGTLTTVKTLDAASATVSLHGKAILSVTTLATFSSGNSTIHGADNDYALLRLKAEVSSGLNAVQYTGHVEVECSNHTANQVANTYYTLDSKSGARMVSEGKSTTKIEKEGCNGEGNEGDDGDDGHDNSYPQAVSLSGGYTYTFEDNYPSVGDYDMNDFVMDLAVAYQLSAANKLSQLTILATLRATGAVNYLAAGLQLDGILSSNVSSVQRTGVTLNGAVFPVSNGKETGQVYAVLPISDDVHATFGGLGATSTNTLIGGATQPTQALSLTVNFSTPVDMSGKNVWELINPFIVNGGFLSNLRNEVHLHGYSPTSKAADLSPGKHYNTNNNLVYAIRAPAPFLYPLEHTSILYAYGAFKNWCISGGGTQQDWHLLPTRNKTYPHSNTGK